MVEGKGADMIQSGDSQPGVIPLPTPVDIWPRLETFGQGGEVILASA